MSDTASKRTRRLASPTGDAAALARTIAEERPEDIAELLNRAKPRFAADTLAALPRARAVEILDLPALRHAASILSALPAATATDLLRDMSADRAVDIVRELRVSVRNDLLGRLDALTKAALDQLLPYREGCAGAIMTTEFVAVPGTWTVGQTLDHIRAVEHTRETIYAIFVLDPGSATLLRAVALRTLIAADPGATLLSVAPQHLPVTVTADTPVDATVELISKYHLLAIGVVDAGMHLIGIVTVDDAVDLLVARRTSDVQHLGGMEPLEASYTGTGFFGMIQKRAGWLCVLFLAEMLTASAMQTYEHALEKAIVLSLFIPLIMSSGGNSGSQATSLIIRALALQEVRLRDWWRVILRELPSGLCLGAILGVLGAARVGVWQVLGLFDYGPHWKLIAATIAASLVGIVTFGSLVGAILPFVVKRLGFDPATASAPFVATLVDVTGIVIYFTIATLILSGTLL